MPEASFISTSRGRDTIRYFSPATAASRGSGKATGLGFPSPGKEADLDVVDRIPDRLPSRPDLDVATSEPLRLEAIETLAPDQDVHVDGEALEPVLAQGYGARDGVIDPGFG